MHTAVVRSALIGAAAAASAMILGTLAVAISTTLRELAGKRVAILGAQTVGKTTLLQVLRDKRVPTRATRTVDPAPGGRFAMDVDGKTVHFDAPRDLPGNDGMGFPRWKEAFTQSDFVWYLFRADLMLKGDAATVELVTSHLGILQAWMKEKRSNRPKVVLIGTFGDKAPDEFLDPQSLRTAVGKLAPIKVGLVKLNKANLVVGSLATKRSSSKLVASLGRNL